MTRPLWRVAVVGIITSACAPVAISTASGALPSRLRQHVTTVSVVPANEPGAILYDSTTDTVFFNDVKSNHVTAFNPNTNTVVAHIRVGINPFSVGRDSTNGTIYTPNYESNTISVINGFGKNVIATVPTCAGGATDNAMYMATKTVYYNCAQGNYVAAMNGVTNQPLPDIRIPIGTGPAGIGIDQSSGVAYVTNLESNSISVLNLKTNRVVRPPITVGAQPFGFNWTATTLYVANSGGNTVSVINRGTNTVTHSITVGNGPRNIAYVASTHTMYVTNYNSNTVSAINTATDQVIATIPVGVSPHGIAYDPNNNRLFVTDRGSNQVSIIQLES